MKSREEGNVRVLYPLMPVQRVQRLYCDAVQADQELWSLWHPHASRRDRVCLWMARQAARVMAWALRRIADRQVG